MSDDINENDSQQEGENLPSSPRKRHKKGAGRPKGSKDSIQRTRMSPLKAKGTTKAGKFTTQARNKFLRFLEKTGNMNSAAAHVGITRQNVYYIMKRNPAFADKVEIARGKALGELESEAVRRGRDGVEKDVRFKGEVVGKEKQYSDGLLTKLLEASDPERYGKKSYNYSEQNINIAGESSAKEKLASLLGVSLDDVVEGEYEEVDQSKS